MMPKWWMWLYCLAVQPYVVIAGTMLILGQWLPIDWSPTGLPLALLATTGLLVAGRWCQKKGI